jgi:glycosidase
MRYTQWMMDDLKVDGFRWDAIKHVPSWFWDTFIDAVLYQRRVTPDGRKVTPFSFGESVESASYSWNNYARKDGFGNRDCLDISGSGELRNLLGSGGFGSWQNVVNAHFDLATTGRTTARSASITSSAMTMVPRATAAVHLWFPPFARWATRCRRTS